MLRRISLVLSVSCFAFAQTALSQFTVERTSRSFTIRSSEPDTCKPLTFRSEMTEGKYDLLRIGNAFRQTLADQLPCIARLWHACIDSIPIALRSIGIGYPLSYSDVLKKHIEAFRHLRNTRRLPPTKIREVMLKARVYAPLDSLIESFGYRVTGMSTEKHGYVPKEELKRLGYGGREYIPMPFIVWLIVKPLSEIESDAR